MVIWLPQVGHCPSCAAIDSVASSRDEQYPQLNPYRRPDPRNTGDGPAPRYARATALAAAAPAGTGTRSVVEQVGQRTSSPACASLARSGVWQTWHGNSIIQRSS